MSNCLELLDALKTVNVTEIAIQAMSNTSEAYVQANRDQMLSGKRKDGTNIGDAPGNYYYSLMYARDKNRKNAKAGFMNPDLKLTGAFQDGLTMTMAGEVIEVSSSDSKYETLTDKYGGTIYGLNETSQEKYNETLFPEIQKEITKITGLNFS
jgi:hypothetical protein